MAHAALRAGNHPPYARRTVDARDRPGTARLIGGGTVSARLSVSKHHGPFGKGVFQPNGP